MVRSSWASEHHAHPFLAPVTRPCLEHFPYSSTHPFPSVSFYFWRCYHLSIRWLFVSFDLCILKTMDELIEKTKALSWNELFGLLKPNRSRAHQIWQASLVGRLVSKKIYPSHIIHPLIRTGWRFTSDINIEDAGLNHFLFTFMMTEDKERVRL